MSQPIINHKEYRYRVECAENGVVATFEPDRSPAVYVYQETRDKDRHQLFFEDMASDLYQDLVEFCEDSAPFYNFRMTVTVERLEQEGGAV